MPVKIKSKKVNENKIFSKVKPYINGVIIGDLLFIIGVLISAFILYKTDSSSTFIFVIPLAFAFLGAFFCGVSVQKKVGGRGFLTGALSSLPYAITILLFVCIILGFKVGVNTLLVIPICISGGFVGGITAVNTRI